MANQEHLELLMRGGRVWNAWKALQPRNVVADLSDAFLRNVDLTGYDLYAVNLQDAFVWRCCFAEADLSQADLRLAHFWECRFTRTNLGEATLNQATFLACGFIQTDFSGADLSDVRAIQATLRDVNLTNTILTRADFIDTTQESTGEITLDHITLLM